jgi:protein pelota
MKILKINRKENNFSVIPDNLDDLWHLERVIEENDVVSAKTERKIKPKEEGIKTTKENIFMEIKVERLEFHESSGSLRAMGVIIGGSPIELLEINAHHTIDIEAGKELKVQKKILKNYQIERLEKAEKSAGRVKTLLVVLDDEECEFAMLKEFGLEKKGKIASGKHGKRFKEIKEKGTENPYFEKIISKVKEVVPEKIIFAGPGFTKSNLEKYLKDKGIKWNAHFEQINSVGVTGLNELIKSGVIEKIVADTQIVKESMLVEKVFEEIGKEKGFAAIGTDEVKKAIGAGAVKNLLVCDSFLLGNRELAEKMLESVEALAGEVHIVSGKHEAGQKLVGIGGVAALLRFSLKWK